MTMTESQREKALEALDETMEHAQNALQFYRQVYDEAHDKKMQLFKDEVEAQKQIESDLLCGLNGEVIRIKEAL